MAIMINMLTRIYILIIIFAYLICSKKVTSHESWQWFKDILGKYRVQEKKRDLTLSHSGEKNVTITSHTYNWLDLSGYVRLFVNTVTRPQQDISITPTTEDAALVLESKRVAALWGMQPASTTPRSTPAPDVHGIHLRSAAAPPRVLLSSAPAVPAPFGSIPNLGSTCHFNAFLACLRAVFEAGRQKGTLCMYLHGSIIGARTIYIE